MAHSSHWMFRARFRRTRLSYLLQDQLGQRVRRTRLVERTMFWDGGRPGGHATTTVTFTFLLEDGRTYILIAHWFNGSAQVSLTFLRENGAPIVKNIEVGPSGRRTFDVGAEAPELQNESFGVLAVCTNCNDITVERSIYWDAKSVFWGGGSNAPAAPLSGFTVF